MFRDGQPWRTIAYGKSGAVAGRYRVYGSGYGLVDAISLVGAI